MYALMTITTYLQSHLYEEKLIDEIHCCPSSVVSLSDLLTPVGHPLSFRLQIATSEIITHLHSQLVNIAQIENCRFFAPMQYLCSFKPPPSHLPRHNTCSGVAMLT